ncbi:hypothetical protein AZSI13_26570 [Azospira sp. I13]|uniref:hypothetical protein n=1 Tax=Azospira sp. I13 TaxID=1765050 RepID=UPI000D454AE1|nr:hypothetical protein [Azospira sp. I13]GBG03330.1 hypothetical protein AZSI13_26570 [Azospira sp. I13]
MGSTAPLSNAGLAGIYQISAATFRARQTAASSAAASGTDQASTQVSISAAAREAAKNDRPRGLALPDAAYWTRQDFPADIMAEAQARLDERRAAPGIGDGYLPNSVSNLPLLPENQALLDQFKAEMKAIGHDNMDPAQNARFNRLLNLTVRVQLEGWKQPMTEADAQRELDISQAMAVLTKQQEAANPSTPKPTADAEASANTPAIPDMMAGWKQRWQEAGLKMPAVRLEPGQSMWTAMAEKAGIGATEFVGKARDLAGSLRGEALTQAIEQFISDRYVALKANAAGGQATSATGARPA